MRYLPENKKITATQRKTIYVLAKQTGVDIAQLCVDYSENGRAKAISEISKDEVSAIIEFLQKTKDTQENEGLEHDFVRCSVIQQSKFISEAQRKKIFYELGRLDKRSWYKEFTLKYSKGRTDKIQSLRMGEASKLIQYLEKQQKRVA